MVVSSICYCYRFCVGLGWRGVRSSEAEVVLTRMGDTQIYGGVVGN